MMKVVSFCMWVCLVDIVLMLSNGFSGGVNRSMLASGDVITESNMMASQATSRNLKENGHHSRFEGESYGGDLILEDYRPFDPSPSSKASVRPGPIQHGAPLIPYIPNPRPLPPRPSHDGLP